MKKIWKMSLHLYLDWLLNYKQLITVSLLLFIYQSVVEPLKNVAELAEHPLHVVEPFVAMFNLPYVASILILAYLILVIDLPNTSGNHTFIVWRINRIQWIFSQCLFTVMSATTFYTAIFLFSMGTNAIGAEWGKTWSQTAKDIVAPNSQLGASIYVPRDLICASSPWDSALNSLALIILSACLVAFILMFFSIKNMKMYGVIFTVLITLIGFGFTYAVNSTQWILPVPNSIYTLHFFDVLCIYDPIFSYIYLIAVSLLFIFLSCRSVRNFSFSFSIEEQDE